MLPKMNLREVAEARVRERGKERMLEIQLAEQRVVSSAFGFLRGDGAEPGDVRQRLRRSDGFHGEQHGLATLQKLTHGLHRLGSENISDDQQGRGQQIFRRQRGVCGASDDLDVLASRLREGALQVVK